MELRRLASVLARWSLVILAAGVLAAVGGYLIGTQAGPVYEARTRLLIGPLTAPLDTLRAAGSVMVTYRDMVRSQPVLDRTIASVGLDVTANQLRDSVTARAAADTRMLEIGVRATDPQAAALIANTLAVELERFAGETGEITAVGDITVIDEARTPARAAGPSALLPALLGGAAGLLIALLLAIAYEMWRNRLTGVQDLARLQRGNVRVVGPLPPLFERSSDDARRRRWSSQDLPSAPGYRHLAARLRQLESGQAPASFLVLGLNSDEQSRHVAARLVGALSAGGRPVTATSDDPEAEPGMERSANRPFAARADALLERARAAGETVVVSEAPMRMAGPALGWVGRVSAVVLVARQQRDRVTDVMGAVDELQELGARAIFVVVARTDRRSRLALRTRDEAARTGVSVTPGGPVK